MSILLQALQKVGACEAQFYNERDRDSRLGVVYYMFLSDAAYKR